MSNDLQKALQVHFLNLDDYLHEEIYRMVDEIADPSKSLSDIDETHCRALDESFRHYIYSYQRNMMTLYLRSFINSEGGTNATSVHNVDGMELLRDGYCIAMLDGCHRHCFVKSFKGGYSV